MSAVKDLTVSVLAGELAASYAREAIDEKTMRSEWDIDAASEPYGITAFNDLADVLEMAHVDHDTQANAYETLDHLLSVKGM